MSDDQPEGLFPITWSTAHVPPTSIYLDSDGMWTASVPSMPGCFASGATLDEVMENIDEARRLWAARTNSQPLTLDDPCPTGVSYLGTK